MTAFDQCHSTLPGHEHPLPRHKARAPHTRVGVTGRAYWRSLDDLTDTPEFRDWMEKEFPTDASVLMGAAGGETRRTFLKLMGASVALAGAATIPGCRRPDHKIMPYSKVVPEEVIPGKSMYYATSMPLPGGGAEGLLIETHEGRPTKVEGNPLHPINRGKTSAWAQASVLGLYDPDRLKDPVFTDAGEVARSWEDFTAWATAHFGEYDAKQGEGLAFLVEKKTSPSRDAMRDKLKIRWPKADWVAYDPVENESANQGSIIAFGRARREVYKLDQAKVIVSLDRDLGACDGMGLVYARDLASTRRVLKPTDSMSRVYVVESGFSGTGGKADHRLRLAPSHITAFAVLLAQRVFARSAARGAVVDAVAGISVPPGAVAAIPPKWIDAVAEDLLASANQKHSVVTAGPSQPPLVHAIVHCLNSALQNVGSTVNYMPMDEEEASSSASAIKALCERMNAGAISTLVCMGVNPVYDAPADLKFGAAMAKVKTCICHSVDLNETVAASNWRLPSTHYLEQWGDARAHDGTLSPVQPMIAPLYGAMSDLELLAFLAGDDAKAGFDIVRRTWKGMPAVQKAGDFEKVWRRALHDGVLAAATPAVQNPQLSLDRLATALQGMKVPAGPGEGSLDAVFVQWHLGDGRYANNAWLQELPETASHIVWDNAALVSPATAKKLNLEVEAETKQVRHGRMATVTIGSLSTRMPVWEVPGLPDHTVILPLGYGRSVCGLVGQNVGFNAYAVRDVASRGMASGVKLAPVTDGAAKHAISTTQSHGSMEGRALVREVDLPAWAEHGGKPAHEAMDPYGRTRRLNFAERLEGSELVETPANVSIYNNPYNAGPADPKPGAVNELGRPAAYAKGPQWGMSIDLSTCTGCNVCTVACQAENNIPVVGKHEVNKGRELHWIRVDRYFAGDEHGGTEVADSMLFQPVACVHCENAPCETVCPVNATVHGPEGINYMVYNRCIGTRYCSNNCPYKVRKFNYFDWWGRGPLREQPHMLLQVESDYYIKGQAKADPIRQMAMNPEVTVRMRGIMEKCTYCTQRIMRARIDAKNAWVRDKNLNPDDPRVKDARVPIADGSFTTACAAACPAKAIVFGDLNDRSSKVKQMHKNPRAYQMLEELNTKPRTQYLARIRNPAFGGESAAHGSAEHAAPASGHGGSGH